MPLCVPLAQPFLLTILTVPPVALLLLSLNRWVSLVCLCSGYKEWCELL